MVKCIDSKMWYIDLFSLYALIRILNDLSKCFDIFLITDNSQPQMVQVWDCYEVQIFVQVSKRVTVHVLFFGGASFQYWVLSLLSDATTELT